MSRNAEISVLTANRLGDGAVVFLDFEGAWSESFAEAVLARTPDEVRALQDRATYDASHNVIVEPYLVEVRETEAGLTPIRYRERVRAGGPSVLDDVPGYTAPSAVPRQAQHGGDRGDDGDEHLRAQPHAQHRPELVEGRATGIAHAEAA
jgi:sulfite reductase (NADPH) hemoprotein beta-component